MLLKFDIYYKLEQDALSVYELVPRRRRWRLHFNEGSSAMVNQLMQALLAGMPAVDLRSRFGSEPVCCDILSFLDQKRLLSNLDESEQDRTDPFLRQLEMFDTWNRTERDPEEFQAALTRATVLVAGMGGVGTPLAFHLTSCGVGKIYCVDFDCVETHNLARQSLFTPADVGLPKSQVVAQRLRERGLNDVKAMVCRLTSDNVDQLIHDCGELHAVCGMPLPTTLEARKRVGGFLMRGIPVMCGSEHDVGPFLTEVADMERFERAMTNSFELYDSYLEQRSFRDTHRDHPSYAPTIDMVCALAVDEVVRHVSGYAPVRTRQGCFNLNPVTGEVRFHRLGGD